MYSLIIPQFLFRNRKRIFGPLHPSQMSHSQMFAVSTDGKLLYAGGIWDNSLRVYSVHKGKTVASVTRHLGKILKMASSSSNFRSPLHCNPYFLLQTL